MGILTVTLKNFTHIAAVDGGAGAHDQDRELSSFHLRIPRGVPIDQLSLVGFAIHKQAGCDARALKLQIPFLASSSGLITASETIDKTMMLTIPLDGTANYQSEQSLSRHFAINEQILRTNFVIQTCDEDNNPTNEIVKHLVLTFQYHQSRLL